MRLILENFICYTYRLFDFSAEGIHYISGPSGCGKSSICKAFLFLKTGQGKKLVQHGKKKCVVRFEAEAYTIIRQKGPEKLVVELHDENMLLEASSAQSWIDRYFSITYMDSDTSKHFLRKTANERWTFIQQMACPERWNEHAKLELKRRLLEEEAQLKSLSLTLDKLESLSELRLEPNANISSYLLGFYESKVGEYSTALMVPTRECLEEIERDYFRYQEMKRCQAPFHPFEKIAEQLDLHRRVANMRCVLPVEPTTAEGEKIVSVDQLYEYECRQKTYQCPHCLSLVRIERGEIYAIEDQMDVAFSGRVDERALDFLRVRVCEYEKQSKQYKEFCMLKNGLENTYDYWKEQHERYVLWSRVDGLLVNEPSLSLEEIHLLSYYIKKRDQLLSDNVKSEQMDFSGWSEECFMEEREKQNVYRECQRIKEEMKQSLERQSLYRTFLTMVIDCERESILVLLEALNTEFQTYLDRFFQGDLQAHLYVDDMKIQVSIQHKGTSFELHELSTGEYARICLALTMVFVHWEMPLFLLLDECVAHLDQTNALVVFETMQEMVVTKSLRILLIAHQVVTGLFEHVISLDH